MPVDLPVRPRNDLAQYDDLEGEWWRPRGAFAALHWLAEARAGLIPKPDRAGAVLLDLACGGGLLAPHVPEGYEHIGLDVTESALRHARPTGIVPVRADVHRLPFEDASADVVVAGELFEHVDDLGGVVAEIARVLRPGGTLVFDTVSSGIVARLVIVQMGERIKGGPPPRIHDPRLFVSAKRLAVLCAHHGIDITTRGLRPSIVDYALFLAGQRPAVRMLPTRSTAAVYQGTGVKR
jgi:2-polyprenyl-6-hydroxyphenyl methylase/3-demethylubiquinone-9 3-methyltransferase